MIDKTVGIVELAKRAGVSPATVSRVINHRDLVKPETVKLVESAMATLNYKYSAAPDAKPSNGVIIVNLPSLENIFYYEIINGIRSSAQNHGFSVLINQDRLSRKNVKGFLGLLKSCKAAGLITLDNIDAEPLKALSSAITVVQCCEYNKEVELPYITIDDLAATRVAMDYIISRNRRKIGIVNGPVRFKYASERQQGFDTALEFAGIAVPRNWIIQLPEVNYSMAFSAVSQVLNSPNRPNAFFAVSDIYAAAIINAAKKCGLRVPQDLIVVGFDNIDISVMCSPSITTVNQPKFQLGFMGCEMLCERIENPDSPVHSTVLATELIIREST